MHTDTSVSLSATVPQLSLPCQPTGLQSPVKAHSVGKYYIKLHHENPVFGDSDHVQPQKMARGLKFLI